MKRSRYMELEFGNGAITEEEAAEGWHWCYDWDEMLVGPGCPELCGCRCDIPVLQEEKDRIDNDPL